MLKKKNARFHISIKALSDIICIFLLSDEVKIMKEKETFGNITWYTHFKCKQRMMYLIYALILSLSLSLSLSLFFVRPSLISIGPNCGLPSMYTSCIHDYNTHMFSCRSSSYWNYKCKNFLYFVLSCVAVKLFHQYRTTRVRVSFLFKVLFFQPTVWYLTSFLQIRLALSEHLILILFHLTLINSD